MDFDKLLKNKNLKVTKARLTILSILNNSSKGLTVEEILEVINKDNIEINISTIYRTLESFEENSLINKINLGQGAAIYSIKKDDHSHKIECDICHNEYDIPCPITAIEELLKQQSGFTITEHKIELTGVCNNCKDNED